MSIKVTINSREVKNPVARFILTLIGLLIFIVVFVLTFFLLLPFVWFLVLSLVLVLLAIIAVVPKLISHYRIISGDQGSLEHKR